MKRTGSDRQPVGIADVELGDPLPWLHRPGRNRVLVRLHGRPLAEIELVVGATGMSPQALAEQVAALAGDAVRHHRDADAGSDRPACLSRRAEVLAKAPHVTVVIATRNRTGSLLRCLRSVSALEYPSFDVVVVDNAPSDRSTATALAGTDVTYVREDTPGLAVAHNRALRVVAGEWVAFTDDDVEVDRHWLTGIAEAAAVAPGVACVTGLILPAELETPAQVLLEQYGGFARGFDLRAYSLWPAGGRPPGTPRNRYAQRPDGDVLFPYTAGRFGSGANMAFDTAALRALGGFDPATGAGTPAMGGDDLVAFLRVLTAGHALVYQPAALVRHWHHRTYRALRRQTHGYGVGLGAYLASTVARDPRLAADLLRRVVPAARHLLASDSAKNKAKPVDFPRRLQVGELLGLARGPFAYARSRWAYRGVS